MEKHDSLIKSTLLVSGLALIGKVLGFLREMLIGAYYGATAQTDAFFFAQSMPGMIFPSVCNSVSTAFLPLYIGRIAKQGKDSDAYASKILTATSLLGLLLSAFGVIISPVLTSLFAPGFAGSQKELAIQLTQLTMAAFFLIMLQYMLGAILNAKKHFSEVQVAGLLYNIIIIVVLFMFGRGKSMSTLTMVFVFAHFIQVVFLGIGVHCCGGRLKPSISIDLSATKELLRMSAPIILGNASFQINSIVDKALASTLPDGSMSALSYAYTLTFVVTGVLIASLSTVIYPTLTDDAKRGNDFAYTQRLTAALSSMEYVLLPITCITMFSSTAIVTFIYGRGQFDYNAIAYTATALLCYAPMFLGVGYREVLTRAFYAKGNTKTPMINTTIGVFCNLLFSLLFVRWIGIAGIALGTTISSFVTASLLLWRINMIGISAKAILANLGRKAIATVVCLGSLYIFTHIVIISTSLIFFVANTTIGAGAFFLFLPKTNKKEVVNVIISFLRKDDGASVR